MIVILLVLVSLSLIKCDQCLEIVTREEWGARSPKERTPTGPAHFVIIHHSFSPESCFSRENCSKVMRGMQEFHMHNRGWNDFVYNFAIGGDAVYEGRGWEVVGIHTKGHNYNSLGIVFIGNYTENVPTKEMLAMCQELIEYGVSSDQIQPNYQLVGARQLERTVSPGDALYAVIKTWSHWVSNPTDG